MKYLLKWNESVDVDNVDKTILFTDVKDSSKMWSKSETEMINVLDDHFKQVDKLSKKFNGLIIKTVGDSFMIRFDKISNAIQFAIDLQNDLKDNPLKVDNMDLNLRIGIAHGKMSEKEMIIQDNKIKDYFGNIVNTASRLESSVSDVGGFAFAYRGKIEDNSAVRSILKNLKVEIIEYDNNCKVDFKRSSRLLSDRHNIECKNIDDLKGIKPIMVYNCKIK